MKKFCAAGLLAVALLASAQQEASAWVNARFSAGVNFQYQSGNNCWLWGLFNNGQTPGPEIFYNNQPNYAQSYYGHPGIHMGYGQVPSTGTESAGYNNYAGYGYTAPYQLMSYPGAYNYYQYGR